MERRAKGQCFHCDEPFHPGHECKSKLYKLLGEEIDEPDGGMGFESVEEGTDPVLGTPGEISLNALAGIKISSTIHHEGSQSAHSHRQRLHS